VPALERLVAENYRQVSPLFCVLVDEKGADDLAQETFMEPTRSLDNFHRQASARSWKFAIARNVCVHWLRRGYRQRGRDCRLADAGETPLAPDRESEVTAGALLSSLVPHRGTTLALTQLPPLLRRDRGRPRLSEGHHPLTRGARTRRPDRAGRSGGHSAPSAGARGGWELAVTRALSPSSLLSALAASAALAGCGGGAMSATTTKTTHGPTTVSTGTSVSRGDREPVRQHQSAAQPLTPEEMAEYDANEGRCHDDRGSVRDVGTLDAYCAFPARSNDFHLIESSKEKEISGEEE
jgi:Sigma-70 region 2